MKVATCHQPHTHQPPRTNCKDNGFADMFNHMNSKKHSKPEPPRSHCYCHCTTHADIARLHMRPVNPHRHHGTEIKPTPEQLVMRKDCNKGCSHVKMGHLTLCRTGETPELVVSKPYEPPAPKYPASIYDIPESELQVELWAAQDACRLLDKEGMSKVELYNKIEQIYKDYLGKDFREAYTVYSGAVSMPRSSHSDKVTSAYFAFKDELEKADLVGTDFDAASKSEMRAAVREKYPKNMTLKDCILMAGELWDLGLTDGNVGYCVKHYLKTSLGVNWSPPIYSAMTENDRKAFNSAFEKLYNSMLDMPADFEALEAMNNDYVKNGFTFRISENVDDLFEKLMSALGGSEFFSEDMLNIIRKLLEDMEADGGLIF